MTSTAYLTLSLPIKTVSETNAHEHWRYRQQRAQKQRRYVGVILRDEKARHPEEIPEFPVRVTFERYGKRPLDDDNNVSSFKHIRDEIAAFYGVNDGDSRWQWVYAPQVKDSTYRVVIRITPVDRIDAAGAGRGEDSNG